MKQYLKVILSTLVGNTLLAFAVCAFVVPNDIMLGGSTGIALAIQHFLPIRLSIISAVVNGCLFLLGWACMGWKFAATSLLSTLIYPVIMAIFETLPLGSMFQENIVFTSLFAALLLGLGIGLVVRFGGSTGGMDIPPCILYKYKGIPVGTSLMLFDSLIVLLQVSIKGLDGILCSIMVIIVLSFTVNQTIVYGEGKTQIIIISPEYEQIRQAILNEINCGVTLLDIETGYEGMQQKAILSVVYASKYTEIREAVLKIDNQAFIVTSAVKEVNGRGYTLDRNYNIQITPH